MHSDPLCRKKKNKCTCKKKRLILGRSFSLEGLGEEKVVALVKPELLDDMVKKGDADVGQQDSVGDDYIVSGRT